MFIGHILANETNTWMCLHPNGTLMAECDDQLHWYPICIQPRPSCGLVLVPTGFNGFTPSRRQDIHWGSSSWCHHVSSSHAGLKRNTVWDHQPNPLGSMYDIYIYGNIYHQYTPNVSIYIPYMDPMGMGWVLKRPNCCWSHRNSASQMVWKRKRHSSVWRWPKIPRKRLQKLENHFELNWIHHQR